MRNLKAYIGDTYQFYLKVIDGKNTTLNDPTYKDRLDLLTEEIKDCYFDYDNNFDSDSLPLLVRKGYTGDNKNDLHKLYSYRAKIFQDLKTTLTTSDTNRVINTCQNCTINSINSFDHFVPQEEFAEFVVNPKNLFPSCTQCNNYKGDIWRANNKRLFLNLFIDQLPISQYLFVDVDIKGLNIITRFDIKNTNGIDNEMYNLINHHYTKLRLCTRFTENNDSVITPLISTIITQPTSLSRSEIIDSAVAKSKRDQIVFGQNYWKSILEIALVENPIFWQYLQTFYSMTV